MFILIIARNFPKKNDPLNGIFEFDQAKALQEYGHKVVLISIDLRSLRRKRKLWKYWIKVDGIDIVNISIPLGRVSTRLKLFTGRSVLKIIYPEILKNHGKPDIVHAHFTEFGQMAGILKTLFQIPLVITEHSSKINQVNPSKQIQWLGNKTYYKADKLLAVSSSLSNNIKNFWGIESKVIHNIVDTSSFKYEKSKKLGEFTFISVGNLIYSKGFDLLIEAFKKAKLGDNVHLKIVGDGPIKKELKSRIDSLDLSNEIKLLGFLSRNEISELMKESHAFVLASRSETFGVVFIEAMLVGLPVIATACGGPEEFVSDQNGILIPVNDIEALTEALLQMYETNNNYNRNAISDQSKKDFSPEMIAEKLTKVYQEILKKDLKI